MWNEYKCGFCDNRSEKNCNSCRIAIIRDDLEEIAVKAQWEHTLKYADDNYPTLRGCQYCKHVSLDVPAYMLSLDGHHNVYCNLDKKTEPVKNTIYGCGRWVRMPFEGIGKSE